MHTLLDYDGNLSAYINITDEKTANNKGAYDIPLYSGSVIVADRFYNDFALLNIWDSKGVHFVIRHKENLQFVSIKENKLSENRHQNSLKDEIIELKNATSLVKYPKKLRRIAIWDRKNQKTIELITNNFKWSANTISELYKNRWQIEIFFREIKQLLHIKSFIGTSENAVMMLIWPALITIHVLMVLKSITKYKWHLSNLVAFIRLNLFDKIYLQLWHDKPYEEQKKK